MIKSLAEPFLSHSTEETLRLGKWLGGLISSHSVILLRGGLGVGKTLLAKGIAIGLEIESEVVSPSFPILIEYSGPKVPFYHFDLYRISSVEEFELLGGEEILSGYGSKGGGCVVIEWPEVIEEVLSRYNPCDIRIELDLARPNHRQIIMYGNF